MWWLTLILAFCLPNQVFTQQTNRCVIQNFNVGVGAVSVSSDVLRPNELIIQLEGLITYGGVVPQEVFGLADVSYSCKSGSTMGSASELSVTGAQEQFMFLCVLNLDIAADCTPENLVLDASAVISDNQVSLGCQRVAQSITSICTSRDNQQPITPSLRSPVAQQPQDQIDTTSQCRRNDIQIAIDQVLRDPRRISKMTVDITITVTPTRADINQYSLFHRCLLNGNTEEVTPISVFERTARFSCEVNPSFPFDCVGNVLEVEVEGVMKGNLQCRSQSSLQTGVCLDHQTGNGLIRQLEVQKPLVPNPNPSNFQCNAILPSIELLQMQPDDQDLFVAILDAAVSSQQSHLRHIQITPSCSSNGQSGVLEPLIKGHDAENIFSCTLRIAWPFSCGSNFIDFGVVITDVSQTPPCSIYTGKRFSYCLDTTNGGSRILDKQDVAYPVVRDQNTGRLGPNSLLSSTQTFSNLNANSIQCPTEDVLIDLTQLRERDQRESGFVLNAVVRTSEGAVVQPQCFINGVSEQASIRQQTPNGVEIVCEVASVEAFSCGENLVSIFVDVAIQNSFTVCRQSGGLQVSVCLTSDGRNSRVFEQLEIPRASILRPFIVSGLLGLSFLHSKGYHAGSSIHGPFPGGKWTSKESYGHSSASHGHQLPGFQHKSYSYQYTGTDHGRSVQGGRRGVSKSPYSLNNGFSHQESPHSHHHGPHLPDCAEVNSEVEVLVQRVQPDPQNTNLVIIETLVVGNGNSKAGQGHPNLGCSLDGRDGAISSIVSVPRGIGFVCTVETHNPFSCEQNIVRLSSHSFRAPARVPCEAELNFRFCIDPQTLQAALFAVDDLDEGSDQHNKRQKHRHEHYGGESRGPSPCIFQGDFSVDLLGIVWDNPSQSAIFHLLLRYQQGPPPEVLMQLQGFNIQPACVLHGNFGETSALIPDLQGVGFTCTIFTQWPRECGANWLEILVELKETGQSFLQSPHLRGNLGSNSWQFVQGPGNPGCNKKATRSISFCVDATTNRPRVLASHISSNGYSNHGTQCHVQSLEGLTNEVQEIHIPGGLPLLAAKVTANYTWGNGGTRNAHGIDSLDPLRDIKCACQGNGGEGRINGLKLIPSGLQFTCNIPLHSRFECLNSNIQSVIYLSHFYSLVAGGLGCSEAYAILTSRYCQQPACQLYAVDMGYHSQAGLLTDNNAARILLYCTHRVEVCLDCIAVQGPRFAAVEHIQLTGDGLPTYYIYLGWEQFYRGPVVVSVQQRRQRPGCSLNLQEVESVLAANPSCTREKVTTVSPVRDLLFTVVNVGQVLTKTFGYETKKGCGSQCPQF